MSQPGSGRPDMTHEQLQELAVGYALDALEPGEERDLLAHLSTCPECRALIDDTHALTAAFTEEPSAAQAPAPALRDRILAAAEAEPRSSTPIITPSDRRSDPPHAVPAAGRRVATGTAPDGNRRVRRMLVRSRVLMGAVAAAVAVAVAVPVTLAVSDRSGDGGAGSTLAQTLLQPGARELTLVGKAGGSARAVVGGSSVILLADGLAPNDTANRTYVLWANDGSGVKPIATFDATSDRTVQLAVQKLPFSASKVSFVAVSIEPGRTAPRLPSDIVLASEA